MKKLYFLFFIFNIFFFMAKPVGIVFADEPNLKYYDENISESSYSIPDEDINLNSEERNNGYISPGLEDVRLEFGGDSFSALSPKKSSNLPARYPEDANEVLSKLPDIRNQDPYGTCWAFSAIATAELNMIKQGKADRNVDYSELALAYSTFEVTGDPLKGTDNDDNTLYKDTNFLDHGGDTWQSLITMYRGLGPVNESVMPYNVQQANRILSNSNTLNKDNLYNNAANIKKAYILDKDDRESVKNAIIENGSAIISFYNIYDYMHEGNNSYECYDINIPANHTVAVVGWDDSINASRNLNKKGAWLVRNSWGYNGMGYNGYFWLSYFDKSIEQYLYTATFSDSFYDNIYQYDGALSDQAIGRKSYIKGANIFTAHSGAVSENLTAVAIGVDGWDNLCTIKIYRDLKDLKNPESGDEAYYAKTYTSMKAPGMYTIDLNEPVPLRSGETFSIVVELSIDENSLHEKKTALLAERTQLDVYYKNIAGINQEQSFINNDGQWLDLSKYDEEYRNYYDFYIGTTPGNLRIKAYTDDNENQAPVEFTDVRDETKEFYTPIYDAANRMITTGIRLHYFGVDEPCTRGQIVTFLWRRAGCPKPKEAAPVFSDVYEGNPFYDAIAWAFERGITTGFDDGTFRQDEQCTRGQAVTFLWRAAHRPYTSGTIVFSDVSPYSNVFYNAILWASHKGITRGFDDGTFRQDDKCTRGQIVTFIYRDI